MLLLDVERPGGKKKKKKKKKKKGKKRYSNGSSLCNIISRLQHTYFPERHYT